MTKTATTWLRGVLRGCVLALVVATAGCAGLQADPIDIHDPLISVESRRYVADAEDAVSIARSGVDQAAHRLEKVRARRGETLGSEGLAGASPTVVKELRALLDARVRLAELELERAQAEHALAERKLHEVYAETAVRHDLDTYDIDAFRDEVDAALERLKKINRRIGQHQLVIDKAAKSWWKTYRELVDKGEEPELFFSG